MNERNTGVMRAPLWRFVDKPHASRFQPLQCLFDVVYSHGNMMNTFAPFAHKLFDGRVGPGRLQEFYAAFSNVEHRNANSLIIDVLVACDLQAHRLLMYLHGCGKRFYGNTDMIDLHHGLPNFVSRTILSTI